MSWVHHPEVKAWLSTHNVHSGVDPQPEGEYYSRGITSHVNV